MSKRYEPTFYVPWFRSYGKKCPTYLSSLIIDDRSKISKVPRIVWNPFCILSRRLCTVGNWIEGNVALCYRRMWIISSIYSSLAGDLRSILSLVTYTYYKPAEVFYFQGANNTGDFPLISTLVNYRNENMHGKFKDHIFFFFREKKINIRAYVDVRWNSFWRVLRMYVDIFEAPFIFSLPCSPLWF